MRYFLASREIPFAGHPTIATVAAMRSRGLIESNSLTLETGAGLVTVTLDGDLIEMTQVAPKFGAKPNAARVAMAIGLMPETIVAPPQLVSTGLPFCITVLRDQADLRAARLNVEALRNLAVELGHVGLIGRSTTTVQPGEHAGGCPAAPGEEPVAQR